MEARKPSELDLVFTDTLGPMSTTSLDATDTLFLLRIATAGTQLYSSSN